MPFDPILLKHVVTSVWGDKPHPDIPEIKVSQYEIFARVAAQLNKTPDPKPQQVEQAYHLLNNAEMAPAEFERLWEVALPLSNRLLNRDPTIHDLQALTHKMPGEIQSFYMAHPHPQYPEVSAGDMIRYYHVAKDVSLSTWGRAPNDHELARFVMGEYDAEDILAHYRDDGSDYGPSMREGGGGADSQAGTQAQGQPPSPSEQGNQQQGNQQQGGGP